MTTTATALLERARSPQGVRMIRYSLVSVISVVVSQVVLFVLLGLAHWTARAANITACAVATVPSYYLNRTWAWGKAGKSHLWKEVAPFWGLAFIGLAFSTWAADFAETKALHLPSHMMRTAIVMLAALGAFGVLWVAKFVIFNEVLFKHHPEVLDDEPALDGRTGLPT